ncbi:Mur ligase family protein [Pseudorhodobacter sp.]|uniref:Mur ligase family protein n=2 Tax=Pseudorhodobacter sp. TaxID=1934400 RepID=UPI002B002BF3|nr:Mur ligase family protein [Pseudorhodobacter sp.]
MNRIEQLEAALTIDAAQADHIHVSPARRLTGPGIIWAHPGAIMDIEAADTEILAGLWGKHARRVLDAVGWHAQHVTHRRFQGGISLALSAPLDQLYSAVYVAQAAWQYCAAELLAAEPLAAEPLAFDMLIGDLQAVMAQEANPALMALMDAAAAQDVDILCDDDAVSIGHGAGSKTWPAGALPGPQDVDWPALHDIPLALITGTNGKTTTTRLCAAIARVAGKTVGLTSTDAVQVADEILERGDFSGPGGARMVLRDPRVEIAVLEVARGGILRRGLATRRARVAVVTNVARDHLGEYGVMTLPELAQAKFAVARALGPGGVLVLNADDPHVVEAAASVDKTICWFSLDRGAPMIRQARALGQPCAFVSQGEMVFLDGSGDGFSIALRDVPITHSGMAEHNTQNALAALCACMALEISHHAIRTGLCGFVSDTKGNPGRLNEFAYNGARVFVDFAHNTHSVAAVCRSLAAIPSKRRFLMLSQPGDHSDEDIGEVTRTAIRFQPDRIVIAEIADYLRGRVLGETPDLLTRSAISAGIRPEHIGQACAPSVGAEHILDQLEPGDLALLLVLSDRENVFALLANP